MGEWAVLWGGLVIFFVIPLGVVGWAYLMRGKEHMSGSTTADHIGSMDYDLRWKRYKDQ